MWQGLQIHVVATFERNCHNPLPVMSLQSQYPMLAGYLHGERNENQWFLRFDLPKVTSNAPVRSISFFRCWKSECILRNF